MSARSRLIEKIGSLQNLKEFAELHWTGNFEQYLDLVRKNAAGGPQRLPAGLRHDPVVRPGRVHRQQEAAGPLQLLQGRAARRPRRHLRARHPADAAGERVQERGRALRHRAPRDPAARPGGQLEEHHRPPAQAGPRGVLAHARGGALHLRLDAAQGAAPHLRRRTSSSAARCTRSRCASSRPSGATRPSSSWASTPPSTSRCRSTAISTPPAG